MNTEELIPTIIQDVDTGQVLMLAYSSGESRRLTREEGRVWLYSRSRKSLWLKGDTSGNLMEVVASRWDCDEDALIYQVKPQGPACHTGEPSCFFRGGQGQFREVFSSFSLESLYSVICQRRDDPLPESYTSQLLGGALQGVQRKVGEEALEVILAASEGDRNSVVNEAADLLYHLLVLLARLGICPREILSCLQERRR